MEQKNERAWLRARILRSDGNAHRYICFLGNKVASFTTRKEDPDTLIALLFGHLNGAFARLTSPQLQAALSAFLALLLLSSPCLTYTAHALPAGYQVVSGDVEFHTDGQTLNITSNSNQAIINYQSFNIGAGETVNFFMPGSAASILNQVLGSGATLINGQLNANGIVLLTNPNGINIGAAGAVQTGGFLASTLPISDANYLANQWSFANSNENASGIVNEGSILTENGGFVVLAGGAVQNTGNIVAPNGHISLAVGDKIQVNVGQNLSIEVTVDEALKNQVDGVQDAILNTGTIEAHTVEMVAELEKSLYQSVVNTSGIVRASAINKEGGKIVMSGSDGDGSAHIQNSGTLEANATENIGPGGEITLQADTITHSGTIQADGANQQAAGNIDIDSTQKTLLADGSLTSARGLGEASGGGDIRIWSDVETHFESGGVIDVQGGTISGDGGFAEVSAVDTVFYSGFATGQAVDGVNGSILIDPAIIRIRAAGPGGTNNVPFSDPNNSGSQSIFQADSFSGFSNVTLEATNDIYVETPWDLSGVTSGNAVTLRARDDIFVQQNITTGGGDINLLANYDFSGVGGSGPSNSGDVTLYPAATLTSNGGDITLSGRVITGNGNILSGGGDVQALSTYRNTVTLAGTVNTGGGDLTVAGRNVRLNGNITAHNLTAQDTYSTGTIQVNGAVTTTGDVHFEVNNHNNNDIIINAAGSLQAAGDVLFEARDDIVVSGILSGGNTGTSINLRSRDDMTLNQNVTTTGGDINLTTNYDFSGAWGVGASGNGDLRVNGASTLDSNGGDVNLLGRVLTLTGNLNSDGGQVTATSTANSTVTFAGAVNTGTGDLTVAGRNVRLNGPMTVNNLTAQDTFSTGTIQVNGAINATGDVHFEANNHTNNDIVINAAGSLQAAGDILFESRDDITISGALTGGGTGTSVNLRARDDMTLNQNVTTTGGDINLTTNYDFSGAWGVGPSGSGDLRVNGASTLTSNGGGVNLLGRVITLTGDLNSNGGDVAITSTGNNAITLTGNVDTGSGDFTGSGRYVRLYGNLDTNNLYTHDTTSSGNVVVTGDVNATGNVHFLADGHAANDVVVGATGSVQAGGNILFEARDDVSITGDLSVNGNSTLTLTGDMEGNNDGNANLLAGSTVSAENGLVKLDGVNINFRGDLTTTGGTVDADATNSIATTNTNAFSSTSGDLLLDAGNDLTLHGSYTLTNGDMILDVNDDITGTNGSTITLTNGDFRIDDGNRITMYTNINARDISMVNDEYLDIRGALNASRDISLTTTHNTYDVRLLSGAGITAGNDVTLISRDSFDIRTPITAGGDITLTANSDGNNAGNVLTRSGGVLTSTNNDITMSGRNITLQGAADAGTGDITMTTNGSIATSDPLSAANITGTANVSITVTDNMTVTDNISLLADYEGNNSGNLTIGRPLTSTNNGSITLGGARIDINSTVDAGAGSINLLPSRNKNIDVGGASDNADNGSRIDISVQEMNRLSAGEVTIGSTDYTGNVDVIRNINLTGLYDLTLANGGNINAAGRAWTFGGQELNANALGNVTLTAPQALSLGSITGNNVTLTAGGADILNSTGGAVDLSATSLSVNNANNVSFTETDGLTIQDSTVTGNFNLTAGADIQLNHVNATGVTLESTGGSILDANGGAMNVTATQNSFLRAGGTIGTDLDPLEVNFTGADLTVAAGGVLNGISVNINGVVNPNDILQTENFFYGEVIFNGQSLSVPGPPVDNSVDIRPLLQHSNVDAIEAHTDGHSSTSANNQLNTKGLAQQSNKQSNLFNPHSESISIKPVPETTLGTIVNLNKVQTTPAVSSQSANTTQHSVETRTESTSFLSLANDINHLSVTLPAEKRAYSLAPGSNRVTITDAATQEVIKHIKVAQKGTSLAYDPGTRYLFVTDASANTVIVIDTRADEVIGEFETGDSPQDIVIDTERRLGYVANEGSNTVTVFNTTTWQPEATLNLTDSPYALSLGNAGKTLTVTNTHGESVGEIDTVSALAKAAAGNQVSSR
ncbi:MAG: filamentous hemagglutinin N-terminal domain-containing protein [Vampirovibrio sp.]|nr:filamentous hemagglutinin N-terminal domain-containing protein [Vampirovibrio sp.]